MTRSLQYRLRPIRGRGATAIAAMAAVLALAGCNPSGNVDRSQSATLPALPATLPLAPGDATPAALAPPATLLPTARRINAVRVADPRDSWAYADDAYDFAGALGDAPPDYGFDYDGVEPWAWQGYDNSIEFIEPLGSGYRTYYYRPGADTPYFVRDPDYGYGYDGGQLAVVYGPDGSLLPYGDYGPRLDYASRYYARGRDLYRASQQRRPVVGANWAARQAAIVATRDRWAGQRTAQPDWEAYHQRTAPQQTQHWGQEQARRRADTVRFDAWRGQDFRTPPPPRAIPVAWVGAKWAHDDHRFAPPASGFDGDAGSRQRAANEERQRVATLDRAPGRGPGQQSAPGQPLPPQGPGDHGRPGPGQVGVQQAADARAQQARLDQVQRQQLADRARQDHVSHAPLPPQGNPPVGIDARARVSVSAPAVADGQARAQAQAAATAQARAQAQVQAHQRQAAELQARQHQAPPRPEAITRQRPEPQVRAQTPHIEQRIQVQQRQVHIDRPQPQPRPQVPPVRAPQPHIEAPRPAPQPHVQAAAPAPQQHDKPGGGGDRHRDH